MDQDFYKISSAIRSFCPRFAGKCATQSTYLIRNIQLDFDFFYFSEIRNRDLRFENS